MKFRRSALCIVLPAAFLLTACSRTQPTAPGVYTLSGPVELTGYLVTPDGDFAGTRVVGDADGVLVELAYGDQIVARTRTVHGIYSFHGIRPGGYTVRAARIGPLYDETTTLTVVHRDLVAADTLRLTAMGGWLHPVPNPVRPYTTIYFTVGTATVDLRVVDLAGNLVRHILNERSYSDGLAAAGWDGTDDAGRSAPDALYWLMFHAEDSRDPQGIPDDRVQLLFR